jgi:hypothetical protein
MKRETIFARGCRKNASWLSLDGASGAVIVSRQNKLVDLDYAAKI